MTVATPRSVPSRLRWSLPKRALVGGLSRAVPVVGVVQSVATDRPVVSLTFDDGPSPDGTPAYLELLDRYGAKATFFCLGVRAQQYPELLAEVKARGHSVGIHGWDHRCLVRDAPRNPRQAWRFRSDQVLRSADAIGPTQPWLFRPPFGHHNPVMVAAVRASGARPIRWSATGMDWLGYSSARMARRVLARLGPGAIVLFHDAVTGPARPEFSHRTKSLAAVEAVLQASTGLRFVTVPELLTQGSAVVAVGVDRRSSLPQDERALPSRTAGSRVRRPPSHAARGSSVGEFGDPTIDTRQER